MAGATLVWSPEAVRHCFDMGPREQHPEPVDVETEALDEADDGYDPTEFAEEDDEF